MAFSPVLKTRMRSSCESGSALSSNAVLTGGNVMAEGNTEDDNLLYAEIYDVAKQCIFADLLILLQWSDKHIKGFMQSC